MLGKMNYIFLTALILYAIPIVTSSNQGESSLEPYRLEILDLEIEYLVSHCHSNDNDFGKQNLTINTSIYWNFIGILARHIDFIASFGG